MSTENSVFKKKDILKWTLGFIRIHRLALLDIFHVGKEQRFAKLSSLEHSQRWDGHDYIVVNW